MTDADQESQHSEHETKQQNTSKSSTAATTRSASAAVGGSNPANHPGTTSTGLGSAVTSKSSEDASEVTIPRRGGGAVVEKGTKNEVRDGIHVDKTGQPAQISTTTTNGGCNDEDGEVTGTASTSQQDDTDATDAPPEDGEPVGLTRGRTGENGGKSGGDDDVDMLAPAPGDDPLLIQPSPNVRENDHCLLLFGDGRQIFAHCVTSWKGKNPPVKINKRSFPTANLVGLPYGTVLELDHTRGGLFPLPEGEGVLPDHFVQGGVATGGAVGEASVTSSSPWQLHRSGSSLSWADGGGGTGNVAGAGGSGPASVQSSDDEGMAPPNAVPRSAAAATASSSATNPIGNRRKNSGITSGARGTGAVENLNSQNGAQASARRPNDRAMEQINDNRHLVDSNSAQAVSQEQLMQMRNSGQYHGSAIVQCLIDNSSTFDSKTDFSKAKYIARKQKKYQPRCRLVRCTGASIAEAMFLKNPRAVLNLREDSLAQMMSYANVYAGSQVLVMESCMGVVTGALAQRMGGYGKILSIYSAQQPPWSDMIKKYNLSFAEHHSIKWIHSGEVFGDKVSAPATVVGADVGVDLPKSGLALSIGGNGAAAKANVSGTMSGTEEVDVELRERRDLQWPCPLQDHTRRHLAKMSSAFEQADFLSKRCNRFARKLTRHTTSEVQRWLHSQSDALIVCCKYDPTETLLALLPYLAASCPFVMFGEHMEPLVECFRELQKQNLAINLRLTDTWMREYQILPGRTHPAMSMSQSGGYLLRGIKLCPVTGHNELQEDVLKDLRAQVGGRRGRKKSQSGDTKNGRGKSKKGGVSGAGGNGHSGAGVKRARFS